MGQLQKLEGLIDNCRAMLKEQLAKLSSGNLAELQQWQESCTELRGLLLQSFELVKEEGSKPGEAARLKERLADLVDLNNELFGVAAEQRQLVAERLGHMRKGKSTLNAYSVRQQTCKPRFLSSNG